MVPLPIKSGHRATVRTGAKPVFLLGAQELHTPAQSSRTNCGFWVGIQVVLPIKSGALQMV